VFTLLVDQGRESRLPNTANMPYLDQGDTNACGTTSLATSAIRERWGDRCGAPTALKDR